MFISLKIGNDWGYKLSKSLTTLHELLTPLSQRFPIYKFDLIIHYNLFCTIGLFLAIIAFCQWADNRFHHINDRLIHFHHVQ